MIRPLNGYMVIEPISMPSQPHPMLYTVNTTFANLSATGRVVVPAGPGFNIGDVVLFNPYAAATVPGSTQLMLKPEDVLGEVIGE